MAEAGADIVIAEEIESIVQLFGEVLRDYHVPAEEIENYEEIARKNGYSALLKGFDEIDPALFACETDEDCLDSRTVTIRGGMQIAEKPLAALKLVENFGLTVNNIRRNGKDISDPGSDFVLKVGDEVELSGPTEAFARNASLFRPVKKDEAVDSVKPNKSFADTADEVNPVLDVERKIDYKPEVDETVCSHLDQIRPVFPSASGCEDCLLIGEDWVHLRICLTCGHVGCCDTSKNKHASKHANETEHPVIMSMEPGDSWAWCFPDDTYL